MASNSTRLRKYLRDPEKFKQLLQDTGDVILLTKLKQLGEMVDSYTKVTANTPALAYLPNIGQEKFHRANTPLRAMFAGNRFGKTTALVLEILALMTGYRPWLSPDDPDYWVFKSWLEIPKKIPVPNIGRIYVNDYKAWERDMAQQWEKWVPRHQYKYTKNSAGNIVKITLSNRSVAYIMTSEMDPAASEGGSLEWVAYNEPPKQEHFIAAQRGLMDTHGFTVMAMTLLHQEPWIYDEIYEKAEDDPKMTVIQGSSIDNLEERGGILTQDGIDDFAKFLTPEEKAARLHGKPVYASGRIFKHYEKRDPWWIDPVPLESWWPRFFAVDPHPRKPFGMLWGVVDPHSDTLYIVDECYDELLTTISEVADKINFIETKKLFQTWDPRTEQVINSSLGSPAFRWIDPAGNITNASDKNVSVRSSFMDHGIICTTWDRADKEARVTSAYDWFKIQDSSGKPAIQIFNTCHRLDFELRHWYWDPKNGRPRKHNDDLIDPLIAFVSADVRLLAKKFTPDPRNYYRETRQTWNKMEGAPPLSSPGHRRRSQTGY
jgi:hypothetical protein